MYAPWAYTHAEITADAVAALSVTPSEAMTQPLPTSWELPLSPEEREEGYARPRRPRKLANTARKRGQKAKVQSPPSVQG